MRDVERLKMRMSFAAAFERGVRHGLCLSLARIVAALQNQSQMHVADLSGFRLVQHAFRFADLSYFWMIRQKAWLILRFRLCL